MEAHDRKMHRYNLQKAVSRLVTVAVYINWIAVAAITMAIFSLASGLMMSIGLLTGFTFGGMLILGLILGLTPLLKFFLGMLIPLIGRAYLRAGHRQASAVILLVSGGLTIPPIVIGGSLVLDPLLTFFGVLPFLPNIIGGVLLVAAGVLALLSTPPPTFTPAPAVSVFPQLSPTVAPERAVREVVLVICPYCGVKNPQGTTKCSSCGGRL